MADQATKLRAAGLTGAAQVYEDEASSQRETAANRATLTFGLQYVSTDDGGAITFDTEQRRTDLIASTGRSRSSIRTAPRPRPRSCAAAASGRSGGSSRSSA
jgi:hypothetical protein